MIEFLPLVTVSGYIFYLFVKDIIDEIKKA